MKKYDPNKSRAALDDKDTGYTFFLSRDLEESRNSRSLANGADAYINLAVECMLVDYLDPAEKLLKKAHQWLTLAISEQEIPHGYAKNGTEALRFSDLAFCNWLLDGTHDQTNLDHYVAYEERYLDEPGNRRDKISVSLALLGYIDAKAFNQVLERCAKSGIILPQSSAGIKSEGQMCCYLASIGLNQPSAVEIESASAKFLERNISNWLMNGHFARIAHWMKVIHWHGDGTKESVKKAVLSCYQYLPR